MIGVSNLTWEKGLKSNIGFEMKMLDSKSSSGGGDYNQGYNQSSNQGYNQNPAQNYNQNQYNNEPSYDNFGGSQNRMQQQNPAQNRVPEIDIEDDEIPF